LTHRDEAAYLLERSKEFLETAKYQINKGFYGLSVFSLEQALQLFLKSKMLASGVDYPRTHSVRALLEMLSDLASDEEKSAIKGLLEISSRTRYARRRVYNFQICDERV
jgi:HEPN domain-containing protein